jgi:hypothetical protein
MIYRLAYVSSLTPAAAATLVSTMEDVLAGSVANNRRDAITGFLLCDGAAFVQVLEGPEVRVESCFGRILVDTRHHLISVRERRRVDGRLFPAWSMCGLTLSEVDDALLSAPDIAFDLRHAATGALIQLLSSLAERHGPELDARHARLLTSGRTARD